MEINNIDSIQTFLNKDVSAVKANSSSVFETILKKQALTTPSSCSTNAQNTISPEDSEYLKLGTASDGRVMHFPADNASTESKKAWIEAMKKLPVDKQMGIKLLIIVQAQLATNQDLDNTDYGKTQKYISGITSYQDVLKEMIKGLRYSSSGETQYAPKDITEQSIKACNIAIDTFRKYNIK